MGRIDRLSLLRRTYAALQHGSDDLKVQCWTETKNETETVVTSCPIPSKILGIYPFPQTVVLVHVDGRIQRLSIDLQSPVENIEPNEYSEGHGDIRIHSHTVTRLPVSGMIHLRLVVGAEQQSLAVYNIKMNSSDDTSPNDTTFFRSDLKMTKDMLMKHSQAALSEAGNIALTTSGPKTTDLTCFDSANNFMCTFPLPQNVRGPSIPTDLRWLNETHLLVTSSSLVSIWDVRFRSCHASISLPEHSNLLCVVAQKPNKTSRSHSRSFLVFSTPTDLYLAQLAFSKDITLMDAMGKQPSMTKIKDSWLQDVAIQSTWKDSLGAISNDARVCITAIQHAKSGAEIDAIMEEFLFPDSVRKSKVAKQAERQAMAHAGSNSKAKRRQTREAQASRAMVNGHTSDSEKKTTNGQPEAIPEDAEAESDSEDHELLITLQEEVAQTTYPAIEAFSTHQTDVVLSVPFVAKLLETIFATLPERERNTTFPMGTVDFLLKKGLLSISTLSAAGVSLEKVVKNRPELRMRLLQDMPGLLPDHLLLILKEFATVKDTLPAALFAVVNQLNNWDESLIIEAISLYLKQTDVEIILNYLSEEMFQRQASNGESTYRVSDDALCSALTAFLDSLGVSNLVLSRVATELVKTMRPCVAHMVEQHETLDSTSSCISELLMKARLLETLSKPKTVPGAASVQSNPEPEARRAEMPLDKVKRPEKGQSQRAKAHARVQGIGALYTIETLAI